MGRLRMKRFLAALVAFMMVLGDVPGTFWPSGSMVYAEGTVDVEQVAFASEGESVPAGQESEPTEPEAQAAQESDPAEINAQPYESASAENQTADAPAQDPQENVTVQEPAAQASTNGQEPQGTDPASEGETASTEEEVQPEETVQAEDTVASIDTEVLRKAIGEKFTLALEAGKAQKIELSAPKAGEAVLTIIALDGAELTLILNGSRKEITVEETEGGNAIYRISYQAYKSEPARISLTADTAVEAELTSEIKTDQSPMGGGVFSLMRMRIKRTPLRTSWMKTETRVRRKPILPM